MTPHDHDAACASEGAAQASDSQRGACLDLALWMRFFSGAWLPSTSMASGTPAGASRRRLRPTLLTERLRARATALLASRPTRSREACKQRAGVESAWPASVGLCCRVQ